MLKTNASMTMPVSNLVVPAFDPGLAGGQMVHGDIEMWERRWKSPSPYQRRAPTTEFETSFSAEELASS